MGILTVFVDDAPTLQPTVNSIDIVLEEAIVLTDLPDLPTAFAYLFGLLYALNMEFPKELKYTFEAIQHIFMELSASCSQRVRSLKTKLLLEKHPKLLHEVLKPETELQRAARGEVEERHFDMDSERKLSAGQRRGWPNPLGGQSRERGGNLAPHDLITSKFPDRPF
ncbi:hypothetical protein PFLUV_G00275550 [Perca fluviatilis]|uniref:Uncharacterized protein n=1 Tax=Perca fluviatilis TaxID=8168 RepID=A0A6A5E1E3_PERFL|nr:hypothetical protein PFLUV_G00275550 [Perca fluviatilis]